MDHMINTKLQEYWSCITVLAR